MKSVSTLSFFVAGLMVVGAGQARAAALLKPTSGTTAALAPKNLLVQTKIQGAFAKTLVTTTYGNPNTSQTEADFIYSAPVGARVTSFAYWYRGEKVVARVVEKARAAQIYSYITSRMRDPALIEMVGKNTFRARIFPVEANTDLKIEIGLVQELAPIAGGALWKWPMREETKIGALQNVRVEIEGEGGLKSNLGSFKGGKLVFAAKKWRAKEDARVLLPQNVAPLRASLVNRSDGGRDSFFALQLVANRPIFEPKLSISGVKTYGIVAPKKRRLEAGEAFTVFGRAFGTGKAVVALGGQSVALEFGSEREKNNLPSLFWGAAQIENLSANPKNKAQVMALSNRFGMPSLWTSWLAIPEEERKNFKKQMLAADRDNAAKAFAQAIARGDRAQIAAQRARFTSADTDLRKIDRDYSSDEELQPLGNYLNEELKRVRRSILNAKYGNGATKKQAQTWLSFAKRLEKAGAKDGGDGVEMPVYVLEDEMRIASRLLAIEIEGGRSKGKKARGLRARLRELGQTEVAERYGWDGEMFLNEQAEMRAQNLAMSLAVGRKNRTLSPQSARDLQSRLARLSRDADADTEGALKTATASLYRGEIDVSRARLRGEIVAGRPTSPLAKRAAKNLARFQSPSDISNLRGSAWQERAEKVAQLLAPEINAGRENSALALRLDRQLAYAEKQIGHTYRSERDRAYDPAIRVQTERLAREIATKNENPATRARFNTLMERVGGNGETRLKDALEEQVRVLAGELRVQIDEDHNAPKALELEKRLRELGMEKDTDRSLSYAYERALQKVGDALFEAKTLRGDASEIARLEAQFKALDTRAQIVFTRSVSSQEYEIHAPPRVANRKRAELYPKVAAGQEETPEAVQLQNDLAKIAAAAPATARGEQSDSFWPEGFYFHEPGWYLNRAYRGRAHESAYNLAKTGDEKYRVELEKRAARTKVAPEKFLAVQKARVERGEPMLTAEQYRLLPGDPLISVSAPRDSQSVVAILPSGEIKPLSWNALNRTFETRFDVPTYAAPGDYAVQILIVANSGKRVRLTLHFAVDTLAPSGIGSVQNRTLRLQTGEDTDRVSAFLKNGARVDLRRGSDGVFVGEAKEGSDLSAVKFVLTDRAHNRTTLEVER